MKQTLRNGAKSVLAREAEVLWLSGRAKAVSSGSARVRDVACLQVILLLLHAG